MHFLNIPLQKPFTASLPPCALTIGNFDGVHLGHQAIIEQVIAHAKQHQCRSAVLSFEPHPKEFLQGAKKRIRLQPFRDKFKQLAASGIDAFYCLPFNVALQSLSAHDFVRHILLEKLQMKSLIVGEDFRFGAQRQGNVMLLQQMAKDLNFDFCAHPDYGKNDCARISSSVLRDCIQQGDLDRAESLLGRPYHLSGKVKHGEKRGRQLGYPTINLPFMRYQLPVSGIYAVTVSGLSATPLLGVASVGYRPHFALSYPLLEVHLFDFRQEVYGKEVTVHFYKKLREELKFDTLEALIAQMAQDAHTARVYLEARL